jgi:uncharacterized protein VirK/YbjX
LSFNRIIWLWSVSSVVCEGSGFVRVIRRLRFVIRAILASRALAPMLDASAQSALGRFIAKRPEAIGAVVWPYQCAGWDAETRLARICEHFAEIDAVGAPLDFDVDGQLSLLDLSEIRDGLHVVIDQAKWFMREGQLVINLFVGEVRMFSLAFSLGRDGGERTAFVGAVQGRDIEGVADEYRDLTKAAHGMRPRDLLFEIFRMLCSILGVTRILAVSDQFRHHRSAYFGGPDQQFSKNYNEMWVDRGGEPVGPMFFAIKVEGARRELSQVPAKKRAMYRRRYDMIEAIGQQLRVNYQAMKPPCRMAAASGSRAP